MFRFRGIGGAISSVAIATIFLAHFSASAFAQMQDDLATRIAKIISRPQFEHTNFGIEFFSLDTGKVLYARNVKKLFVPASTTKLFTEGTVLAKLGPDYRFHTRIYRAGTLDSKGLLKGDLVLVASGDPNLSNRIQPDGTLSFQNEDHSYNGPAVPGDPLLVIKELAKQVAAKGVRKIDGCVLVDASLFSETGNNQGASSIVVNDNLIDIVAVPGAKVGDSVAVQTSPQTSYVQFVNQVVTAAADTKPSLQMHTPPALPNSDGPVVVTISGSVPVGIAPQAAAFGVPSPTYFVRTVLAEALAAEHISLKHQKCTEPVEFSSMQHFYTSDNQIAEHISPPLSEEIKVTLKVSHNIHATMGQFLLGALAAQPPKGTLDAGFAIEREFLEGANLDLTGISQGDGAGGDRADLFSPDLVVHYLTYWTTRPEYSTFFKALPILGRDGTLAQIQTENPAAGHVFAKTGTIGAINHLTGLRITTGKGLAGYIITKTGEKLVFCAYLNNLSVPASPDPSQSADIIAGQTLGEIAGSAYDLPAGARGPSQ